MVGGVRFASIIQDFTGQYDGLSAAQALASSHANFRGVGLMVGGEAHWTIGWGFSLFGRTRAGIVVGNGTSRLTETNNAGVTLLADVSDSFSQTVPVVEMGLGLAWSWRRFWVRVGYDASNWFQLADTPVFADATSPGKIAHRESNLSLDGFFVQVGAAHFSSSGLSRSIAPCIEQASRVVLPATPNADTPLCAYQWVAQPANAARIRNEISNTTQMHKKRFVHGTPTRDSKMKCLSQ